MEGCYERLHFGSQPENKLFLSLTALTLSGKFGSALVMGLWMEDCWDWTARAPWMSSDVEEKIEVLLCSRFGFVKNPEIFVFVFRQCEDPAAASKLCFKNHIISIALTFMTLGWDTFVSLSVLNQKTCEAFYRGTTQPCAHVFQRYTVYPGWIPRCRFTRRKCYFLYHLWVIMSHVGHPKKDLFLWFLRNLLIS